MEGQPEETRGLCMLCCRLNWLEEVYWDVQSLQPELLCCALIVAFESLGCILVACHN